MVETVFSHRWIARRDRVTGVGHALVFYGFLLLFAGTAILGLDSDFTVPVFHWSFWQGGFFLGYKLVLDVAGLMLLAGLSVLVANRWIRRPARLDYRLPRPGGRRPGPLALPARRPGLRLDPGRCSAVTGFLLEGLALAQARPSWAAWSPVGWVLMKVFTGDRLGRLVGRGRASRRLVDPRARGARVRGLDPVHQGRAHARRPRQRGGAQPASRQGARRSAAGRRAGARSATRSSPTCPGSTCSRSTPAPSAASAPRRAPPRPPATRSRRAT